MADFDWRGFLGDWSRELIACDDIARRLPEAVKAGGWLGYPGASEAQLGAAEKRLGRALPSSYRAFLKVSNGWRSTGFFIDRLWPAEQIDWFRHNHAEWIADWNAGAAAGPNQGGIAEPDGRELPATLQISAVGDSAVYLLDPLVRRADGEWQAWFFSNWNPGANRYPSFQEMMQAERKNFLYVRDHRR